MRVLGVPVVGPQTVVVRVVGDAAAIERLVRSLPDQLERGLQIGDELVEIGHQLLDIAERLDGRAADFHELGERLDTRAVALLELGQSIRDLGGRIDDTGGEIVERAGQVVGAAADLISLLPAMERAVDLASPLGGAIDRFGRIVDWFPGGTPPRRRDPASTPERGRGADVVDHPGDVVDHSSVIADDTSFIADDTGVMADRTNDVAEYPADVVEHPADMVEHPADVVDQTTDET